MPVVLLVDDQPFIGLAVQGLLAADPGIELHTCHDPREAQAAAGRIHPSLVLIDLVMPDVDGLTLIRRLRADPATASTSIVAMSGNADERSREEALAAGANDFIVKLPAKQELIDLVRRHADRPGSEDPGPTSARPTTDEVVVAPGSSDPDENRAAPQPDRELTLDRTAVASLRDLSPDSGSAFVVSLIDLFISEAEVQVAELRGAVARGDGEATRHLAHRLAGSSNTIGARRLATLSGQLEDHAVRNRGAAVGRVLVHEIVTELAQVRTALERERSEGSR
jgi:DNA-binding response OmpR family regulator